MDPGQVVNELLLPASQVRPEAGERFLYVMGVLLLPFCLMAGHLAVRRFLKTTTGRRLLDRLLVPVAWLLPPACLVLLFAGGFAEDPDERRMFIHGGWQSLAVGGLLAAGLGALRRERCYARTERVLRVLIPALAGLFYLWLLAFTILGPEHVRNEAIFAVSFNAFFHSVVQVHLGKQLLVDFDNQYGLYPHFLEPLFRVVGLSVYTLTIAMGILTCLAFWCFHRFMRRETGDRLLSFLGLTTLVSFCYFAGRVTLPDLYLQYHPLRILFPALSLITVQRFANGPTPRLVALLAALGATATLWNPDSGLVVLIAAFLLVGYDALLRRRASELPWRLLLGFAAAAAVVCGFSLVMRLQYGSFPDYLRLLVYPKAYYLAGGISYPMNPFGLWVAVVLVYAAALLRSLAALADGEDTPRARLYFYLPVLGLGLFSYYQGRSVLGNLLASSYPAMLLCILFAGDLRRRQLSRVPDADRLAAFSLLALLCFSLPSLAAISPKLIGHIAEKVRFTRSRQEGDVLKDARFIRYYVKAGGDAVMMSKHSGLLHLITRTTNPLGVPGASEILFSRDVAKQKEYLEKRLGPVVIDRSNLKPAYVQKLCAAYPPAYDNPFGNIVVFPARPAGGAVPPR